MASERELQQLSLEQIVARLTPRDVEYFASRHGCFLHHATMLKLCDPASASSCWYCSRFGQRLLPHELQQHFLPLYPTVGPDGTFTAFAERWRETLAGRGGAYRSDDSLVSKLVTAAYKKQPSPAPSDELVAALAKQTLLRPESIRALFKKHHEQAQRASQWEAPHRTAAAPQGEEADGDGGQACEDDTLLTYDGTLVGRR